MGFRFRRSIKLLPGVRINASLSGLSLSLGGRGATVNLSKRGVRRTFGIPGTGLSWSSSSRWDNSGARSGESAAHLRQIEAARRQAEIEERRETVLAEIAASEGHVRDVVNHWRKMPTMPSNEDYLAACNPRPFTFEEPAPHAPEMASEEANLRASNLEVAKRERPLPAGPLVLFIGGSILVGAVGGLATGTLGGSPQAGPLVGVVVAVFGAIVSTLVLVAKTARARHAVADDAFRTNWPAKWEEALRRHDDAVRAWAERRDAAQAEWDREEAERIEFAQRLLGGDPAALDETVSESLGDLDFPFSTECRVAIPDAARGYVLLDLPEIEDVVPERQRQVLADGNVREVGRTNRSGDYALLAAGLALLVARTTFSAGPTLSVVRVAAYTQRRQRRHGVLGDEFVFEAVLRRDEVARLDPATVDPILTLKNTPSRFDLRDDFELKPIEPPAWIYSIDSSHAV